MRITSPAAIVFTTIAVAVFPAVISAPASAETAPGTLLESSPLDADLLPEGAASGVTVRYTTMRTAERAGESTGVVFEPTGDRPADGWPIVSYAHGTVGIADACAPSLTGTADVERPAIESWLSAGYAVAATDYAGLGTPGVHSYLDGPAAGANTVDIVRAAHRVLGERVSPKWLATGLSQGGNAAYFAAAVATQRAPELDYRGAVAIAGPTQMDTVLSLTGPAFPPISPTGFIGYVSFVLAGLADQRPELNVPGFMTPLGLRYLSAASQLCAADFRAFREANPATLGDLMTRPLSDPTMAATLRQMQHVPTSGYDRPILVTQSLADQTVPAPLTFAQSAQMSAAGVDYRLVTFATPGHIETLSASTPAALDFAGRVMQ